MLKFVGLTHGKIEILTARRSAQSVPNVNKNFYSAVCESNKSQHISYCSTMSQSQQLHNGFVVLRWCSVKVHSFCGHAVSSLIHWLSCLGRQEPGNETTDCLAMYIAMALSQTCLVALAVLITVHSSIPLKRSYETPDTRDIT